MAKAAFAVLGAVAAQSLDLDCPGPWIEFRGKLYQAANPNIRHFAIASQEVLSLAGKFQAERPSTSSGDCPLGEAALRIIESLQIGEGVEAVTIASDFELLEALGWSALVRSGWPIFQLLYLLHKHAKPQHPRDPSSTCFQMDNYARTLQRALQHQPKPGDVGLTASSWSFLSRKIAASCSSLASAAIVAIAWARLPVYDIETEGLLYQAQQLTFLADLAFAHADHPLPLVVARFVLFRLIGDELVQAQL
ncbi:Serine/threonine-protein kinasePKR2 [Durusdinium trenchii]|uniref:Serine/threonine-protein kinasePKR2 n=1 Tax=Durusdinium trenchii TaxID=1381693 RepID=A0ABP0JS65_9DINO